MSALVVDASVAAKLFAEEEFSTAALSILDARHQLHAPDFLFLELDSIICKWIRRSIITEPEGDESRTAIKLIPMKVHPFMDLRDSAYVIANRTHQSVYDCLYVALAVFLDARMITADHRLFEGLSGGPFGKHMMWVEEIGKFGKKV